MVGRGTRFPGKTDLLVLIRRRHRLNDLVRARLMGLSPNATAALPRAPGEAGKPEDEASDTEGELVGCGGTFRPRQVRWVGHGGAGSCRYAAACSRSLAHRETGA